MVTTLHTTVYVLRRTLHAVTATPFFLVRAALLWFCCTRCARTFTAGSITSAAVLPTDTLSLCADAYHADL